MLNIKLLSGASVVAMLLPSAALAQGIPPGQAQAGATSTVAAPDGPAKAADPATPTAGSARNVDESGDVIVTARRREENIQRVPVAVTAFTAEQLAQKHIDSKEALAAIAPSMITITGGGPKEASSFAIRGQGPAFGAIPGVIVYFAEVPNAVTVDGREGTYYDLSNVQVLEGPQGTLFGKNATGGNVMFSPQLPTSKFEGYVQGEFGDYLDRRLEGALNVPVADGVGLRVSGAFGRRDGYTTDVGPLFNGKKYDNLGYESFRAILAFQPAAWLKNTTIFRYYHSANDGPGTVLTAWNPEANQGGLFVRDFFPSMATAVALQQQLGIRKVHYDQDQYSKTKYWQATNTTVINLSSKISLKNIVSYSELRYSYGYDFDATTNALAGQGDRSRHESSPNQITEELQLQGTVFRDALQFALGGYYDNQTLSGHESSTFNYFPVSTVFVGHPFVFYSDNKYGSHAVFGQGTLDVGKLISALSGLSLTAGYRYTWEHTFNATQVANFGEATGKARFQYGSYTLTANYQVAPRVMVYATTRTANKSGGVNGPVPVGSNFRFYPPEKLRDVELGLKSRFEAAGIRGRVNIDAYRGQYNNIQRTTNEVVNGALLNVVRSAAKGRIQGVDFDGELNPGGGITLTGTMSYTDSAYTKVTDATANAILAGSAFPYTPKFKYTAGIRYDVPAAAGIGAVYLSALYVHQGRFSTSQTNQTVLNYLPGYGLLNLRLGIDHVARQPISLAVFVTNATNKKYSIGVFDAYNQSFGFLTQTYGEPRMFGLQARLDF
jgi:iron complex outermembrane receptor protein